MKQLFSILTLLVCINAFAQQPELPLGSPYQNSIQRGNFKKALILPKGTAPTLNSATDSVGAAFYNTTTKHLNVFNGNAWDDPSGLSVNTIADLNVVGDKLKPINVKGFYALYDGGGGTFLWDDTSTATPIIGMIIQVTGITTGRWKRIVTYPLNIKWFGAKGIGIPGYKQDSVAILASINYLKSKGGGELYFPKSNSYYGWNGQGITLGDNIEIFGDGAGITEIKHVNPESAVSYFPGVIFFTTSYATDNGHNPIAKAPKYPIYDAYKGQEFLKLRNINDTVHFPAGKILLAGSHIFYHHGDVGKIRLAQSDINSVVRVALDTLFTKFPISQDITADTGYAKIYDVNSGTTSSPQLGTDFMSQNISIHDITLSQANNNLITNQPFATAFINAPPIGLGGTLNSNYYNILFTGGAIFGGNLFGHVNFHDNIINGSRKLFDYGFNSCENNYYNVKWTRNRINPADTTKETGFMYINDNNHEFHIWNVNASGNWNGTNMIKIGPSASNIYIENVRYVISGYNNNNAAAIDISEDDSLTQCKDIFIKDFTVKVDTIGRWIDITGNSGSDTNRLIQFDKLTFLGYPNKDSSNNGIRINNGGTVRINDIYAEGVDTFKTYGATSNLSRYYNLKLKGTILNLKYPTNFKVYETKNAGGGIYLGSSMYFTDANNLIVGTNTDSLVSSAKNTAIGNSGFRNQNNVVSSTSLGFQALSGAASQHNDSTTAIGTNAFNQAGSTVKNGVALGVAAGANNNGNRNTFIGTLANATNATDSNAVALGYNAKTTKSNQLSVSDSIQYLRLGKIEYKVPLTAPTTNQVLTATDNSGTLQFQTPNPAPSIVRLTTNDTMLTAGLSAVLSQAVTGGKSYFFKAILWTGCSTANGLKFAVNVSGAGATLASGYVTGVNTALTSTKWLRLPDVAGTSVAGSFNNAAISTGTVLIEGFFSTTNNGSITIQSADQTGGDTSVIYAGSTLMLTQVTDATVLP